MRRRFATSGRPIWPDRSERPRARPARWYGEAKPEGHNREALVALRKLGKRELAGILAAKGEGGDGKPKAGPEAGRSAGNRTATAGMYSHFRRRVFLNNNCRCAILRRLVNTSKMVGFWRVGGEDEEVRTLGQVRKAFLKR